ncbi:MAG: hypothetical protein GQE15_33995 [Archangiaceae bacterium]|nr:hypothetical protein [Archangiaceae bacterium]
MRRLLPVLMLVQACAPPTSMVVEFTTNLPCPTQRTAQYLGVAFGGNEEAVETTFTEVFDGRQCDDQTGVLGTYAFRPAANDREQTIFLRAALAPAGDVEAFCSPKESSFDARRCVIARRRIRFTPGATLRVPLLFHDSCLGKPCDVNETCVVGGRCVSKNLITPMCRPSESCVVELDAGVGGGNAGGGAAGGVAGGSATGGGTAAGGTAAGGSAGGGTAAGGTAAGGSAAGGIAAGGTAAGGTAAGGTAAGGSAAGGSAAGGTAAGGTAAGGTAAGGTAAGGTAAGGTAAGGTAAGGTAAGGTAAGGTAAGGTAAGGSAGGGSAGGASDAGVAPDCVVYQGQFCQAPVAGCCLRSNVDAGLGICSTSTCAASGTSSGMLVGCIDSADCLNQPKNCWVRGNTTVCLAPAAPTNNTDRRSCGPSEACTSLQMPNCQPDRVFPFLKTCQCDPLVRTCLAGDVCVPSTRQCLPMGAPSFPGVECQLAPPGQAGVTCIDGTYCCQSTVLPPTCEPSLGTCPGMTVGCRSSSDCATGSWCSYDRLTFPVVAHCLNGIEAREACRRGVSSARNCEGGGQCTGIIDAGPVDFGFCQ